MDNATRNFRSNPLERLGIRNEEFKEVLNQIAFTKPSVYFALKKKYTTYLLSNILSHLHGLIYVALTEGKTVNENGEVQNVLIHRSGPNDSRIDVSEAATGIVAMTNNLINPAVPGEIADKIAMDVVLTLRLAFQEDVIDRIFTTEQIDRAFATASRRAELDMNNTQN